MSRKSDCTLMNCVRELRNERKWTQHELAQRIGVSRQTVVSLEAGGYVPSLALALRIARVFSASVETVFWLNDENTTRET